MTGTCISVLNGWYCPCSVHHGEGMHRSTNEQHCMRYDILRSSVNLAPRLSKNLVEASRSEPNCANAATSRYCARYNLRDPANFFMIFLSDSLNRLSNARPKMRDVRLGGRTDTRYGETDVDGRANTSEEKLRFQEYLRCNQCH